MSDTHITYSEQDSGYPRNPGYGSGIFRRRIRLTRIGLSQTGPCEATEQVLGELEDCNHGFRVRVYHDGDKVVAIEPEFMRIPFTTCATADLPLQKLVGATLQSDSKVLARFARPGSNCTHLLDLSLLAIAHAGGSDNLTQWDVEVTDESDDASQLKVLRNGAVIHHWQAREFALTGPAPLAGNTLFKGFSGWANELFSGLEHEAAHILQKGYYVAQARRYDVDSKAGELAIQHDTMLGNCHTYSAEFASKAIRNANTIRDFTADPEQLLKFR